MNCEFPLFPLSHINQSYMMTTLGPYELEVALRGSETLPFAVASATTTQPATPILINLYDLQNQTRFAGYCN